jgi:hypothetical protein
MTRKMHSKTPIRPELSTDYSSAALRNHCLKRITSGCVLKSFDLTFIDQLQNCLEPTFKQKMLHH